MKELKHEEVQKASNELRELFGEYPGVGFILGRTDDGLWNAGVYFATGRHELSRARRLYKKDNSIWTRVTDTKQTDGGNQSLLSYLALAIVGKAIIVGNGVHNQLVYDKARKTNFNDLESMNHGNIMGEEIVALDILKGALREDHFVLDEKFGEVNETSFLPDNNSYTSRVGGCLVGDYIATAVLSRNGVGKTDRVFNNISLIRGSGKGYLVQSYAGVDQDPLPSFEGLPKEMEFPWMSAEEAAQEVDAALNLRIGGQDIRVGVAAVFQNVKTGEVRMAEPVNRHKLEARV